ncbi:MBOAT family protein [Devosia sp. BSSL-BM10]|uniref:Probable alginate O-acetylase AlgI n=1 Tax=Devosia litorisediminis TaxID=2829817 RepID=A0A942I769_9HYPH|nr:MBOAT family protein [Devosia litorisediminis]MBS3849788.1 MBOAT family protein [Devosia litorisediminis]
MSGNDPLGADMLFYDLPFYVLFALVLPLNFALRGKARITMLLAASYIFYGWWDWRFLSLLIISTAVDYIVGIMMERADEQRRRKALLAISMLANLGMLGFFKYFNFFTDTFVAAFSIPDSQRFFVDVVLPPGISFYTFQTMSYTIDIYRRRVNAERSILTFATFVSFFPQLVAGPIERPGKLIPQLHREPKFHWANVYYGSRLFILGLFKKLVIADNLAKISDAAFADPSGQTSVGLAIAAYCFAIQIYCDFSGYTDMARGVAKMIGVNLSLNFNLPYWSRTLNEFWRRWHMTLSYWLRDYVYIPLGGSRQGLWMHCRNLLITFTLSGLWHGASWTFVLWGVLHGSYIIGELLVGRLTRWRPPPAIQIFLTFHVVVALWILFRAQTMAAASAFYTTLLSPSSWYWTSADQSNALLLLLYASPLVLFQLWQFRADSLVPDLRWNNRIVHGLAMGTSAFFAIAWGATGGGQFIYFQF